MTILTPNGKPVTFIFSDPEVEREYDFTVPLEIAMSLAETLGHITTEAYVVIIGRFEGAMALGGPAITVYEGLAADEGKSVCEIITAMARHDCANCPIPDCENRETAYVF